MDLQQPEIYITLDIDWVADEVIDFTVGLLSEHQVTSATFFVTHKSPALARLRERNFELGIHPNLAPLLDPPFNSDVRSARQRVRELKQIVPEATSLRTHGLVRSTRLSSMLLDEGLAHEANSFIPWQSGIIIRPYEHPPGLIQTPHNWGDYSHFTSNEQCSPEEYLQTEGLKILNFHPIHLFLNTADSKTYNEAKRFTQDYRRLCDFRSDAPGGTRFFFESLVRLAREDGFCFRAVRDIRPSLSH